MQSNRSKVYSRIGTATVVAALLFAAAGCGDPPDDSGSATSVTAPTTTTNPPEPTSDPAASFVDAAADSYSAEPGAEAPDEFDAFMAELEDLYARGAAVAPRSRHAPP